jgi:hypothetical protein
MPFTRLSDCCRAGLTNRKERKGLFWGAWAELKSAGCLNPAVSALLHGPHIRGFVLTPLKERTEGLLGGGLTFRASGSRSYGNQFFSLRPSGLP